MILKKKNKKADLQAAMKLLMANSNKVDSEDLAEAPYRVFLSDSPLGTFAKVTEAPVQDSLHESDNEPSEAESKVEKHD